MYFIIFKKKNEKRYRLYTNQIFSEEKEAEIFGKKSMKRNEKYKVVASQTIYATYEIEVEAEDKEDAENVALNTYINDWDDERFENGDALDVDEIEEVDDE